MKYFVKNNILAQQHYIPIYRFKVCRENKNNFPELKNFIEIQSQFLFIELSLKEQNKVINKIKNYLNKEC